MPLLKKKYNKKEKEKFRLVGWKTPTNLFNFLTLYCLTQKIAKTGVLLSLLENWCMEISNTTSIEQMEKQIAEQYIEIYRQNKVKNVPHFLQVVRTELEYKFLDVEIINNILKHIAHGTTNKT